jgi:Tfp pilus assembly protein PilP
VRARALCAALRVVAVANLATVFAGCGGTPPPAPAPQVSLPNAGAANAPTLPPVTVPQPDVPKYEQQGRRDPFEALEGAVGAGGGGSLVTTAKLTGIVRSARATLALVETPEGIGYILKAGDTLGDGRLVEIGSDSVVFQVEKPGESANRVVLRMAMN